MAESKKPLPQYGHDEVDKAVALYQQAQDLFHLVYDFMSSLEHKTKSMDPRVQTDLGYVCRELEQRFDSLRKDCKARKEAINRTIAVRAMQLKLEDDTFEGKFRGCIATGTPDVKNQAATPKRGTPEYHELLKLMGVSEDVAKQNILDFSWKGISDYITELAKQGKKLPPGIGKPFLDYQVVYRRLGGSPIDSSDGE